MDSDPEIFLIGKIIRAAAPRYPIAIPLMIKLEQISDISFVGSILNEGGCFKNEKYGDLKKSCLKVC